MGSLDPHDPKLWNRGTLYLAAIHRSFPPSLSTTGNSTLATHSCAPPAFQTPQHHIPKTPESSRTQEIQPLPASYPQGPNLLAPCRVCDSRACLDPGPMASGRRKGGQEVMCFVHDGAALLLLVLLNMLQNSGGPASCGAVGAEEKCARAYDNFPCLFLFFADG